MIKTLVRNSQRTNKKIYKKDVSLYYLKHWTYSLQQTPQKPRVMMVSVRKSEDGKCKSEDGECE